MTEPTTAAGRMPTPDDPVHRDEHGNAIEDYHLCGCRPARQQDTSALRLLRELAEEVGAAPIDGTKPMRLGAWIQARNFLAALPPSAPPALDLFHLGSAITWADDNAKPDGIDGNWWVRAIAAEYARLEQDR